MVKQERVPVFFLIISLLVLMCTNIMTYIMLMHKNTPVGGINLS